MTYEEQMAALANTPGGMSTVDGGYMTGYVPPAPVIPKPVTTGTSSVPSASTSTTTAATDPTLAELGFSAPDPLTYGDKTTEDYYTTQANQVVDENKIYRDTMKKFQAEIDAVNQVYDEMYRAKVEEGRGRLGSTRAISARGGLLGSDFAAGQKKETLDYNASIVNAVNAERNAKIGAIMGTVRQSAADEVAAKRKAKEEGIASLLDYNAKKQERLTSNMATLAGALYAQGVDPREMDEAEIAEIATTYGTTADNIFATYDNYKAEQDAKAEGFTLSEGQARYDSQGNVIASKGKTYAPKGTTTRTAEYDKTLLGGGWSAAQIDALDAGIKEYGLQEVIAQEKANGATPAQIRALEKAYKVDSSEEFLSKDYFKSIMSTQQLEKAAAEAGYGDLGEGLFNLKDVDTESYLASLESMISAYRQAGFTDKEILEMMQ